MTHIWQYRALRPCPTFAFQEFAQCLPGTLLIYLWYKGGASDRDIKRTPIPIRRVGGDPLYCPHSGQAWQQNNGHLPGTLLIYLWYKGGSSERDIKRSPPPSEGWGGGPLCHPELNEDSSNQGNFLPLLIWDQTSLFLYLMFIKYICA